ncbi:MAG: hypothetical protein H6704_02235 [Myxococcales bacterium]|nr:hypothetical protein [Myxococcales bacterium]
MGDATRPFERVNLEAPTGPLPTGPDARPADAPRPRRRRPTIPHPGVPITRPAPFVTGAPAAPDADTREFVRQRFSAALQTGGFGSAPAGPLIFKLEAPAPLPTETGSMPTPAELGPLTQEMELGGVDGLPELSIEAPARAGVYRLPEHRQAAPDAPTAPPARPGGAATAQAPSARAPGPTAPGPPPAAPTRPAPTRPAAPSASRGPTAARR